MKTYVRNILQLIAVASLAVFILLGIIMVLIQFVGIVTLNGTLASSIGTIKTVSIAASGVLGISSFLLSYMKK